MRLKHYGMYIHTHWSYKYPYAARNWRLSDWSAYLKGLKKMGFNLLQIWPMIDTMPLPLTKSDEAHLKKIQQVIELAHAERMLVFVGACANTIGNSQAGN